LVSAQNAADPRRDHSRVNLNWRGIGDEQVDVVGLGAALSESVKQDPQRARYSEQVARVARLAVDARDPQRLLQDVPRVAVEALHVEHAVVYLLNADRVQLRVAAAVGLPPSGGCDAQVQSRLDGLAGAVVAEGGTLVDDNGRHGPFLARTSAARDSGLGSALAVPLFDCGRVIGVFAVWTAGTMQPGIEDVRFLETLSSLLAASLQRACSDEALSHAQGLKSVGQLTGGIAHDFNNLLTVIKGNLQLLEDSPVLARDAHCLRLVGAAARATKRGAELTGKLLAFSRRQLLQPSKVDVSTLLNGLSDMLRHTLDQRIRIEVDASPSSASVLADAGQLESALLNVAINARDAMPQGGTIRFRGEALASLPLRVRHELDDPSVPDDGFVAIAISDTGAGMSDEVRKRAFEPFFTTKEAGRGTGLGLSSVYGFVKQSNGAIALDSAPGAGTTVTLYLPQPSNAEAAASAEEIVSETTFEGLKVLLVEDDAEVHSVVRAFLGALHCEVTAATNGERALEVLAPEADFDLLLTDIALGPGARGTQVAREAQRRFPDLAVLLMSGFSAELLAADRESATTWELLCKPYGRADWRERSPGPSRSDDLHNPIR